MGSRQPGECERLIPLGQVMGAHGVHGDLKVKLHNPGSDLLLQVERVVVCQGDRQEPVAVRHASFHGRGLLMTLSGCDTREAAQALYGAQLCVPREALPAPEEDEFYLVDAIGARAVRPDGTEVGTVEGFIAYPAADVLCVRCPDGVRELPVLPPYLVEVDLARGHVVVDHIEDIEPNPEPRRR